MFELGIAECSLGLGVARLDPGTRLWAVYLFQPNKRIVVRGNVNFRHCQNPSYGAVASCTALINSLAIPREIKGPHSRRPAKPGALRAHGCDNWPGMMAPSSPNKKRSVGIVPASSAGTPDRLQC